MRQFLQLLALNRRWALVSLMAPLVILLAGRSAPAQAIFPGSPRRVAAPADALPQNSKLAEQLETARKEIGEKKYRDALRRLGLLVGSEKIPGGAGIPFLGEDHFYSVTPEKLESFGSLKTAALETIAKLPPEGIEVYEDLYGRLARAEFDDAVAAGDIDKLSDISRRFFHTAAGYEAAYRVAAHHLDHNRPMAALRILKRLLEQPRAVARWEPMLTAMTAICWAQAERSEQVLDQLAMLREGQRGGQIVLGGRRIDLTGDDASLMRTFADILSPPTATTPRFGDYPITGGDPTRNQRQADSFPFLQSQWEVATAQGAEVREDLHSWIEALNQAGDLSIPAAQPLLVDDMIIIRTVGDEAVATGSSIRAYDLETGALRWRTLADAGFDPMPPSPNFNASASPEMQDIKRNTVAEQSAWHDQTFANLSSDGELIYAVEELDVIRTNNQIVRGPLRPYNLLRAYDAHGGKLAWEIGGPLGNPELPLAGTFFLGPPLPVDDRLYCLAEQDRYVKLLVLNPANGELLWAQNLMVVSSDHRTLANNVWRRLSGISPAYSQGVMICPTGLGGVVAFDVENRTLLWHEVFQTESRHTPYPRRMYTGGAQQALMPGQENPQWINTTPLIDSGRVLIAAQETPELYCLDVLTGKILWRKQQLDRRQVVGVQDGRVFVVGKNEIEAFRLDDGKPAWNQPISIPPPSGRAVLARRQLLVPLSTAEIIAVDPATGQITNRAASPDGTIAGNLLCLPNAVIAQGLMSMIKFEDVDFTRQRIAARLKDDPQDAHALRTSAELAEQSADHAAAVDTYRRVVELTGDATARERLLDLLLAGLANDFPTFAKHKPEIEQLLDTVQPAAAAAATDPGAVDFDLRQIDRQWTALTARDRRSEFLRSLTRGYIAAGAFPAALETLLQYAPLEEGERFDAVARNRGIRRDRWFAAQIADLLRNPTPELQQAIDQRAEQEFAAVTNPPSAAGLRRFATRYDRHPAGEQALRGMIEATTEGIRPLETEFALLRLRRDPDERTAAFATAKLATLLLDFGRISDAIPYLKELQTVWADVPVAENTTGRQFVDSVIDDSVITARLNGDSLWPVGEVDVESENRRQPVRMAPRPIALMEVRERSGIPWSLQWNAPQNNDSATLEARDSYAQKVWSVEIPSSIGGRMNFNSHARACADLLVVMTGNEILAIDALGWTSGTETEHAETRTGQVLWRKTLSGPYPRSVAASRANNSAGLDLRGRRLGELGPVTTRGVFYRAADTIFAVEPITGETLWQRGGIEQGSNLYADEDRLMVLSRDLKTATFYSMLDGELLGSRDYIPGKQLVAAVDGNVLHLQHVDGRLVVRFQHIWSGDTHWQREFPQRSLYQRVGHDELAVLSPDGQLQILNIANGAAVFETPLILEPGTDSFTVIPSHDVYTVMLRHPVPGNRGRVAVPRLPHQVNVHGTVHGIRRRDGRWLWSRPIDGQAFDKNQPADLPMLVFINRVNWPVRGGRYGFATLCLDKRTGRPLYKANSVNGQVLNYEADEKLGYVTLGFGGSRLQFKFTDKPVEDQPDDTPDEQK